VTLQADASLDTVRKVAATVQEFQCLGPERLPMIHSLECTYSQRGVMGSLEDQFADAIMDTYRTIRAEVYNPSYFWGMISDHGALMAAHMLLQGSDTSEGFERLHSAGRLELTVEAVVLDPKWRPLFSEAELNTARKRLAKLGYSIVEQADERFETDESGWPTVRALASILNEKSAKHRIGRLQSIRKQLKGLKRSQSVLFDLETEWVAQNELGVTQLPQE
jgi:hypothetical protein